MLDALAAQKRDFNSELPVSLGAREDRLDRAIAIVVDHGDEFTAAIRSDFGTRSAHETRFIDLATSVGSLKHARKNVARWMRPGRRRVEFPLNLFRAKARVEYQPLGVIGLVSPWNVPLNLTFAPLAGILAAGNRCMVKPSEFAPDTAAALADIIPKYFDPNEIYVVTGGAETGAAFCSLPFDHLLFTGATSIAKHVLRAAAENMVPVTLELGGKSPVIVGQSADLERTAESVLAGKLMNAGQTCIAPDHAFVPNDRVVEFTLQLALSAEKMFPTLRDNPDYASIISDRHYDRLGGLVEDAKQKGAHVIPLHPEGETFSREPDRKFPPSLIMDPDESMGVMQDEIFGPLLPVVGYDKIDDVLQQIAARPHPLALYYFGKDAAEEETVLARTISGGVSVNDVMMHAAQEDLPFGGVGCSGTGAYHGRDGFLRFSHRRAVFTQSPINVAKLAGLRPPYGKKFEKLLARMIRK